MCAPLADFAWPVDQPVTCGGPAWVRPCVISDWTSVCNTIYHLHAADSGGVDSRKDETVPRRLLVVACLHFFVEDPVDFSPLFHSSALPVVGRKWIVPPVLSSSLVFYIVGRIFVDCGKTAVICTADLPLFTGTSTVKLYKDTTVKIQFPSAV